MAMGMNLGLTKMTDATPGISYHQLANVRQWRMYDDALNRAEALLVNFQQKLTPNFLISVTKLLRHQMECEYILASLITRQF